MKYLILMLLVFTNVYAIVSIVPVSIGNKPGISGLLKGSLETRNGNSNLNAYAADGRLQYDNNSTYVTWIESSFNYGESSNSAYVKNTFSAYRYIHTMYIKPLNWEFFLQMQTNEFLDISERYLGGAGLRYGTNQNKNGQIFFGFGAFYEHVGYNTSLDPSENNKRLNIYIAYNNNFTKDAELSYFVYLQPKLGHLSDCQMLNSLQLKIQIYEKFGLDFSVSFSRDTKPAIGIKSNDIHQKTSFVYEF